jgi:AraC-like DNA-binding protein
MSRLQVATFDAHCNTSDDVEEFYFTQWRKIHKITPTHLNLRWNARFFVVDRLTLISTNSDESYKFETSSPCHDIQFVIPRNPTFAIMRAQHATHNYNSDYGGVLHMRHLQSVLVGPNWSDVQLSIPYDIIEIAVSRMIGFTPTNRIVFDPLFSLSEPGNKFFAHLLYNIFDTAVNSPDFATSPLSISAVSEALVQYTVMSLRHNYSNRFEAPDGTKVAATARRAVEYMQHHIDQPIAVSDIAAGIGVNVRTLQLAFKAEYGCTPMHYVRRLRLHRVRAELKAIGPNVKLMQVALKWGFPHYYLFRRYYLNEFGEDPLTTAGRDTRRR